MNEQAVGVAVSAYESQVEKVRAAISATPDEVFPAATDDDGEPEGVSALEQSIDDLIVQSKAVEDAIYATPGDPDVAPRIVALVDANLRIAHELDRLAAIEDDGEDVVTASDWSFSTTFQDDLAAAIGGIRGASRTPSGGRDFVDLADTSPKDQVVQAIDEIVSRARSSMGEIVSAAVLPDKANLLARIDDVFGAGAKKAVEDALKTLKRWKKRIMRALTKLFGFLVDQLARLIGADDAQGVVKAVKDWIAKVWDSINVLDRLLGIDQLKAATASALEGAPDAPDRAAKATALVDPHDRTQDFIGHGVTIVAVAKFFQLDKTPWGPVVLGAFVAGLLVASGWSVNDFLDARDLPLPSRVDGVRTVVGAAASSPA